MTMRQEKIQEQLVHEVSRMIQRELKDARLGFITLTGAEISRDLRHAKVFVSVMGDDEAKKQTMKALKSAAGLLRGEFARRAHLRVAPELEFVIDDGIARGQRIFELLHSVEADLKPREVEPEAAALAAGAESTSQPK